MKHPKIRHCHQIYRIGSNNTIYIGRGMDKVYIENPAKEFEQFLLKLNGKNSIEELLQYYPKADEWVNNLDDSGVIEWDHEDDTLLDEKFNLNRYSRQIFYFSIYNNSIHESILCQKKLLKSKIAVLGVGDGGTALLRYLNSVGIGTIHMVDFDDISLSNLATHTVVDESHIHKPKIDVMEEILNKQNSNTKIESYSIKFNKYEDILAHIQDCDFIFQSFDKPMGKAVEWVNSACLELNKPYASIGQTDKSGRVGNIVIPGITPCAKCIGIPEIKTIKAHDVAPLTGPLVAVLAGIMVQEVVKFLTNYAKCTLLGNTLSIDSETWEIHHIKHQFNKECKACGHLQK